MEAVEQRMKGVNIGYWKEKFARNMKRDDEVTAKLRTMGWTVIRLWESDVKRNVNGAADIVAKAVRINNVDIS